MDGGAWQASWGCKESDMTEWLHFLGQGFVIECENEGTETRPTYSNWSKVRTSQNMDVSAGWSLEAIREKMGLNCII